MAPPIEQLKVIQKELDIVFKNSPYVQVIPLDEPPEKYEIRYTLPGYVQNKDGSIAEGQEHTICISIPFGFPHFPPSCTPKTPTFHPDFDQAAICIGEFWNKDRKLSELIIHIGKMIVGEIFSTENVFNDSALEWYRTNSSKLPFKKIDFAAADQNIESLQLPNQALVDDDIEPLILSEDDLIPSEIDTMEEDDFLVTPDYLSNDIEKPEGKEISSASEQQTSGKSSVNRIHLLIQQKRFFELSLFLAELPEETQFDERKEIEEKIENLVGKAKKLSKQADEFEHQGDPSSALEIFEQIAVLVPDYPNIAENIERTKNSVELANEDWASDEGIEDDEIVVPQKIAEPTKRKRIAFFQDTSKTTIKFLPILSIIIVAVLALLVIFPYFKAGSKLEKANQLYLQCQQSLKNDQFVKAQKDCEAARSLLKTTGFFKQDQRTALQTQIGKTLNSEEMVQGIKGQILFQGQYVSKSYLNTVLEFNTRIEEADKLYKQALWQEAAGKYTEALQLAKPIKNRIEDSVLKDIENKRSVADINLTILRGEALIEEGQLDKGNELLATALEKAQKLPQNSSDNIAPKISQKLKDIEYLKLVKQGKQNSEANDWGRAITQYNEALKLRAGTSFANQTESGVSLQENIAEAELFFLINSGKESFSQSKWDEAITRYGEAIGLLNTKKDLLQRIDPNKIQQQIERVILRANIFKFRQSSEAALEDKRYDEAIAQLQQMVRIINTSGFEEEQDFLKIIEEANQTIDKTEGKAVISGRISYLYKNFKEIFTANYSGAVPENLSEPKITFLKYAGRKEIYELQCLENNRGRKHRLLMNYSYDPARNKWAFFSEPK